MTTTLPAPVPATTGTDDGDDDDELCHIICPFCYPDDAPQHIAFCGADVTDSPYQPSPDPDEECLVCLDLEKRPCPGCASWPA